jgi:glycine hydroxymethyltransferase
MPSTTSQESALQSVDPEVAVATAAELKRQQEHLELIASENYCCPAILEATGSVLTDKYAEGYPGRRYYGGCQCADTVERLAIERAKQLFGAEHANVQPHAGSQANMAVYMAVLRPGDKLLGMALSSGGHLTHGHHKNFSGLLYEIVNYAVNDEGWLDYDKIHRLALEHNPAMIVAGASAYSRTLDFERFRKIAEEIDAYLMVDIAHIAGLVASGVHPSPVPHADFVTGTTHKTLRGPRGGFILCRAEYAKRIDDAVFPGMQGGPMMHTIAAKAVAFKLAAQTEFRRYQRQIVANSAAMAAEFMRRGMMVVSGGTDNHLFLVDLVDLGLSGRDAEEILQQANITLNRDPVPNDPRPPAQTSGIRIGTPAMTTRGMKEDEGRTIAGWIAEILTAEDRAVAARAIKPCVLDLCARFPIPA